MNKNVLLGLVVLVLVGFGVWWMSRGMSATAPASQTTTPMATMAPEGATATPATTSATAGAMKEFTVNGSAFKFDPATLTVNKGDHVKITFVNQGGQHDWVLDEFNAKTPVIASGKTAVVEFTADKAGTFEYYCSVGNHRAMGMKGTLTVQ